MASAVPLHDGVRAAATSRNLLTCVTDRRLCARFQESLRGIGVVHSVATLAELIAALDACEATTDFVVVPPRDTTGREAIGVVREIVCRFPQVAIIAFCRADVESSADIRALAVAGVHEFVFAGDDAKSAIHAALDGARRECAAERVLAALSRVLPPRVHPLVEACVTRPTTVVTVDALASVTGLHRKTLYNQCVQSGAPSPAALIAWSRLALVAYFLSRSGRTIESLANELEFPSPTALRNMMKRYTGLRAGEIRDAGGLERVAGALAATIAGTRPRLHVV